MASLKYYIYAGAGEWALETLGYQQAVRVGDRIEISGQGGWRFADGVMSFPNTLKAETEQAFDNVETTLKAAGGQGWSQVYRLNSYHTDINDEATDIMVEMLRKWKPDHKIIWTQIGVKVLGLPDMNIELEVVAHDPEGAKTA